LAIVYLVGIKHSGKSSVGKEAVSLLNPTGSISFFDTDDLATSLMDARHASLRQFYREQGKEAFMDLEYRATAGLLAHLSGTTVIATGGGACDNDPLVNLMRTSGTIVYLSVEEQVLFERIMAHGLPPFLDPADPRASFHALYLHRDALYRQISDCVVSLSDYRSILGNAQILADCLRKIVGSEEPCREIPLEQH